MESNVKFPQKIKTRTTISLVQFSCSVMSDFLRPHESQHSRPPCPSPTPGVHSNSRPLSHRCHPAISSSVVPFSSCPQSLPASESFLICGLLASGGQSIGASASASVLPVTVQDWFPLGLTGLISALCKVISRIPWNSKILQLYINIYYLLTTHILYHFCALDK